MSWAVGFDTDWQRDIGYGVPAFCDHPSCDAVIDRGLSYVCGGDPYGGDQGCGLYFCLDHLIGCPQLCIRCGHHHQPFESKPDHPDWITHKLTDKTWAAWRDEHPEYVSANAFLMPPLAPNGPS